MTHLKRGDEVTWDSDSWTVERCDGEREVLADGSAGALLVEIWNEDRGLFVVREPETTVTAWAPTPTARNGDEDRPQ